MTLLYIAASFLSAVLVFAVQPLASRMVLPDFGGSAAVWTTSVLFFQVVLLLGYLYSHVATNWLRPRIQMGAHIVLLLLPALVLPLSVTAQPGDGGTLSVVTRLLTGLAAGVGLPFLLVSTSGPLLQRWFSWTTHPRAADPYFLYAASNVGSILGLLSYPLVVEPFLDLRAQAWLWTGGYGALVALVAVCAVVVMRGERAMGPIHPSEPQEPVSVVEETEASHEAEPFEGSAVGRPWSWVGLSFVPSSLMLGVTTFLTTDLASMPLLWVVPLAVYLGTFVVAFGAHSREFAASSLRLLAPITILAAFAWLAQLPLPLTVALVIASFGCMAMVFHDRLAASRPPADGLTGFYVWMSVGGALGGVANSIVAPLLLPAPFEFLIVSMIAALVAGRSLAVLLGGRPWRQWVTALLIAGGVVGLGVATVRGAAGVAVLGIGFALFAGWLFIDPSGRSKIAVVLAVVLLAAPPVGSYLRASLTMERSFFGSYRVVDRGDERLLFSGTTLHGQQSLDGDLASVPASYYHPGGPVGDWLPMQSPDARIGVIGLGAGSLAAYTRPGQLMRFHEIDPAVVDLADRFFTFLELAPGNVDVVVGDGRLTLEEVPNGGYDALLVDAFSSDSIPVHLLTREAFEAYDRVLTRDGVLLVHISNRYLDLEPVVLAGGDALGFHVRRGFVGNGAEGRRAAATWMALSRDTERLDALPSEVWTVSDVETVAWTDSFSNIVGVLER